jgi:hypothetical protein
MKAAGSCGYPDFAGGGMAIDDYLAAVIKFNLQDALSRLLKIQVGGVHSPLDAGHGLARKLEKVGFIHRVASSFCLSPEPGHIGKCALALPMLPSRA